MNQRIREKASDRMRVDGWQACNNESKTRGWT